MSRRAWILKVMLDAGESMTAQQIATAVEAPIELVKHDMQRLRKSKRVHISSRAKLGMGQYTCYYSYGEGEDAPAGRKLPIMKKGQQPGRNQRKVLELLAEHGPLSLAQMSEMGDLPPNTIHDSIYGLRAKRLVYIHSKDYRRVDQKAGVGGYTYGLGDLPDAEKTTQDKPPPKPKQQVFYTADEFIGAIEPYAKSFDVWGQLALYTGVHA
jgi:predicted ArsR family transcriptional regulator